MSSPQASGSRTQVPPQTWMNMQFAAAEAVHEDVMPPATPPSSPGPRRQVPDTLIELIAGIRFPDGDDPVHWAQWVMEMAHTIAPSQLAGLIERETKLVRSLAGLVASAALQAVAQGLTQSV